MLRCRIQVECGGESEWPGIWGTPGGPLITSRQAPPSLLKLKAFICGWFVLVFKDVRLMFSLPKLVPHLVGILSVAFILDENQEKPISGFLRFLSAFFSLKVRTAERMF